MPKPEKLRAQYLPETVGNELMLLFLIVAVILIGLYEGPQLIKRRYWRELGAVGLLIGAASYLVVANILGWPAPLNWLENLLGPIGMSILK